MTDHMAEDLPAPWPDVLDALRSISGANAEVFRLVEMIRERHDDEMDGLRSEIHVLRERFNLHVDEQRHFNRAVAGLEP